jgi:hypothetical protein
MYRNVNRWHYYWSMHLGGYGRLWHWDNFNRKQFTDVSHYASPSIPDYFVEQGFKLLVNRQEYHLYKTDFPKVEFKGQYPIGEITYQNNSCPVTVSLDAYSPFIPLDSENSGLPATTFEFTLTNHSCQRIDASLIGKLQNAVALIIGSNRKSGSIPFSGQGIAFLEFTAVIRISGNRVPEILDAETGLLQHEVEKTKTENGKSMDW